MDGNVADATSLENEPDLIAVVTDEGVQGYVYSAELRALEGWDISSPEEALAWERDRADREAEQSVTGSDGLTMYESDGQTVIGVWEGFRPVQ